MIKSHTLSSAAEELRTIEDAIERLRFCRNVQRTIENYPAENERRARQLAEAVDYLLSVA